MAIAEKRLKNRELLLLVADAAGDTLDGRTVAQKLLYFAGIALRQSTGHTAYFYGPYSEDFEAALSRAVLAGELSETTERIPDWYGGADATKHIYTLTPKGKAEAARIAETHAEEARIVSGTIGAIAEAIPGLRQKTLSAAAKIHLILSEQEDRVTRPEVMNLAKKLGWHLSTAETERATDALLRLGMVVKHA